MNKYLGILMDEEGFLYTQCILVDSVTSVHVLMLVLYDEPEQAHTLFAMILLLIW